MTARRSWLTELAGSAVIAAACWAASTAIDRKKAA